MSKAFSYITKHTYNLDMSLIIASLTDGGIIISGDRLGQRDDGYMNDSIFKVNLFGNRMVWGYVGNNVDDPQNIHRLFNNPSLNKGLTNDTNRTVEETLVIMSDLVVNWHHTNNMIGTRLHFILVGYDGNTPRILTTRLDNCHIGKIVPHPTGYAIGMKSDYFSYYVENTQSKVVAKLLQQHKEIFGLTSKNHPNQVSSNFDSFLIKPDRAEPALL